LKNERIIMEWTTVLNLLIKNQWYLFYLAGIMVVAGYAKHYNWFFPIYQFVVNRVQSKRAVVAMISALTGMLPIPGRVSVSAGVLDTISSDDPKSRQKLGMIDYLSTHHYYLWSPLEKTIILPMAAFGLTYWAMLSYMWPLLVGCLGVVLYYLFVVLKEEDVNIIPAELKPDRRDGVPDPTTLVDWQLIGLLALIIIFGNFAREYTSEIKQFVDDSGLTIVQMSIISFIGSFFLGSSSRFAALTVVATTIFGIEYLAWFFALDYAGYILSPVHKCVFIGWSYFKTPIITYYKALLLMCVIVILFSLITLI